MQAANGVRMHCGHPDFRGPLLCLESWRYEQGHSTQSICPRISSQVLSVRNRSERSDYVDVLEMCVPEQDLGRKCWRVEVQMFDIGHKRDEHGGSVECLLRRRRLLRVHCTVYLFHFMHILLALASMSFTDCGLWDPWFPPSGHGDQRSSCTCHLCWRASWSTGRSQSR